uniref:60S ribosomal protein L13 n=1 Tax=Angiostrongylus cantonensis TaxID=6313 RepID=A0A0K0DGC6_ANGCA
LVNMAPRGNQMLGNAHFRKHWMKRIKTWFNQPGRKLRRRENRRKKAVAISPRPVAGLLRSVVRCPTQRYNRKVRLGRGFTLDELKAVGIGKREARTIGIAVDYRRTNRSLESLQANVERLKEYKSKLILFPKKLSAPRKGDSNPEELKVAAQLHGDIMPVSNVIQYEPPRAITEAERKIEIYRHLRRVRADKKYAGIREKRAREVADENK